MALLDKLRQELDRAGRQASAAFDEGRLRLELYRAKQSVDRFARRFGYAVFRAKQAGGDLPAEELASHMSNMAAAEAEVKRLETLIDEASKERRDWLLDTGAKPSKPSGSSTTASPSDPPAGGTGGAGGPGTTGGTEL